MTTTAIYLPPPDLSAEQNRRATCLAIAFELTRGRSVPIDTIWKIARWLHSGGME